MSPGPNRDPQAPEIRAWGRENGWDVEDAGRIPAALRSAWATANAGGAAPLRESAAHPNGHANGGGGGPVTFTIPDYEPPDDGAPLDPLVDAGLLPPPEEQPPQAPPRRSWRDRLRRPQREERRPRPRRRVSLENLAGLAWAGIAQVAANKGGGRWLPVANVMAYQAPVAGMVAEDSLKHTMADALLQPVARVVESGSVAGSLLGPPALVGLVCARPELYPLARPLLAMSMREWVVVAGPKLRELKRREEKFEAEMAALNEEYDGMALDIDSMIDAVFAPMFQPVSPDAMRQTPDDAGTDAG